jgi:hypothetical protein
MTSMQETISRVVGKQMETDENLRAVFEKHFGLKAEDIDMNPGYRAYAGFAVEVGVALANLVLSVKKPDSGRGFRAISDLTYALNANEFWVKNAPVLVPVLTIVLNSHRDYVDLISRRLELGDYAVYDKMMSASDGASLEIFSMLLYLVGGPALMNTASLPLKMDLAPFLLN